MGPELFDIGDSNISSNGDGHWLVVLVVVVVVVTNDIGIGIWLPQPQEAGTFPATTSSHSLKAAGR